MVIGVSDPDLVIGVSDPEHPSRIWNWKVTETGCFGDRVLCVSEHRYIELFLRSTPAGRHGGSGGFGGGRSGFGGGFGNNGFDNGMNDGYGDGDGDYLSF